MNRLIWLGGLGAVLLLHACGGGHDAANGTGKRPPPPPPPSAKAGGLWLGTIKHAQAAESIDAVAMVAEDGRARIVALGNDATVESTFAISTKVFQGSGLFYAGFFDDASATPYTYEIYLQGTVDERRSLTMTWASGWDGEGLLKFTYDPDLYEVPSSLIELAGEWTGFDDDYEPWITLTIDADGRFAADVANGCNPTGRFAIIDERFNLYDVQDVVFDCATGSKFSGFAYAFGDNASAPALFVSIDNGTEALRLEATKD